MNMDASTSPIVANLPSFRNLPGTLSKDCYVGWKMLS